MKKYVFTFKKHLGLALLIQTDVFTSFERRQVFGWDPHVLEECHITAKGKGTMTPKRPLSTPIIIIIMYILTVVEIGGKYKLQPTTELNINIPVSYTHLTLPTILLV